MGYGIIILLLIEVSMCFDSVPFILYPRNDFEKHSEKSAITTSERLKKIQLSRMDHNGSWLSLLLQALQGFLLRLHFLHLLPQTLLQFLVLQVQLLLLLGELNSASKSYWLVVSTPLKNIGQLG